METCIEVKNLTKDFGSTRAIDDVSFTVDRGEIVALLGPNGAGKSTTIDAILGFVRPTEGGVTLFGGSPREAIKSGQVAAVLQTGGLLRDLKVREVVELVASTYPDPTPVNEVLERANLGSLGDRMVGKCSGGEQQRVRFALALLAQPDLLLLDEPTAGMDVDGRQEFWSAMAAEAAEGATILFATHYLAEVEQFAPRTIVMHQGGIVADGATEEIRRRTADRTVTARFDLARIDAVVAELQALPAAQHVEVTGETISVGTADSDAVARAILGPLGGVDVQINVASLETAFMRLTTDSDHAGSTK